MSVSASTLRKLALLNLSAEQMAGVLDILADSAEADESRKAAQRERTRKHREKRDGNVTATLQPRYTSPQKEIPPTPPKEKIPPTSFSEATASSNEEHARFAEFWSIYPNKVGKRDADREFALALKRAPFEAIMAGLRRYVAKTDDRPWCNPSTFLHQDRWGDQPAAAPPRQSTGPPSKGDAFAALANISRAKGWNDEPDRLPGNSQDDQRVPAERAERGGTVVDLRRGPSGDFGLGDRGDGAAVSPQRNS